MQNAPRSGRWDGVHFSRRTWTWLVAALAGAAGAWPAIAHLRAGRIAAAIVRNEWNVHSLLNAISGAEAQVRAAAWFDDDGDGLGGGAFLAEVIGGTVPRALPPGSMRGPIDHALLPTQVPRPDDDGVVCGYRVQVFLPARGGGWIAEASRWSGVAEVDEDRAETEWICYAWPLEPGRTGARAYLIGTEGDVLSSLSAPVAMRRHGPLPGRTGFVPGPVAATAANRVDASGDLWVVTP